VGITPAAGSGRRRACGDWVCKEEWVSGRPPPKIGTFRARGPQHRPGCFEGEGDLVGQVQRQTELRSQPSLKRVGRARGVPPPLMATDRARERSSSANSRYPMASMPSPLG